MTIRTIRPASMYSRLNDRLMQNPLWRDFAKAVDRVVQKTINEPRDTLATIRDPSRYHRGDWFEGPDGRGIINHVAVNPDGSAYVYYQRPNRSTLSVAALENPNKDRELLIQEARRKGFNYFTTNINTKDYARIVRWVEDYWPLGGTENYARFIGFIKNIKLTAESLWSAEIEADLYPFLEPEEPGRVPVWEGGSYYPTAHVQLVYDALTAPTIDQGDLVRLFYLLAPMHLVLHRIVGSVTVTVFTYAGISSYFDQHIMGRYEWEPSASIEAYYTEYIPSMTMYVMGSVKLNEDLEEQVVGNLL